MQKVKTFVRGDDEDEGGPAGAHGDDFDTVTDEAMRWASLADKTTVAEFRDEAGVVNEFALLFHVRKAFPLHYMVFRQTASHLPHEGNTEQLFSRSGALSDDNGKMDPVRPQSGPPSASTTRRTHHRGRRFWSATCSSSERGARPR